MRFGTNLQIRHFVEHEQLAPLYHTHTHTHYFLGQNERMWQVFMYAYCRYILCKRVDATRQCGKHIFLVSFCIVINVSLSH